MLNGAFWWISICLDDTGYSACHRFSWMKSFGFWFKTEFIPKVSNDIKAVLVQVTCHYLNRTCDMPLPELYTWHAITWTVQVTCHYLNCTGDMPLPELYGWHAITWTVWVTCHYLNCTGDMPLPELYGWHAITWTVGVTCHYLNCTGDMPLPELYGWHAITWTVQVTCYYMNRTGDMPLPELYRSHAITWTVQVTCHTWTNVNPVHWSKYAFLQFYTWKLVITGSGNDLAPNRCQAITWTNVDPVHGSTHTSPDLKTSIPVKFTFHPFQYQCLIHRWITSLMYQASGYSAIFAEVWHIIKGPLRCPMVHLWALSYLVGPSTHTVYMACQSQNQWPMTGYSCRSNDYCTGMIMDWTTTPKLSKQVHGSNDDNQNL